VKAENFRLYKSSINKKLNGLKILDFRKGIRPNYWFYSLYIFDLKKYSKNKIIAHLIKNNIQSRPLWGLIHEQKPYVTNQAYRIEQAPDYFKRVVNLPCSSNLSADDVRRVVGNIRAMA
jgi:dTDP-4-amino-4,6-dideoxygalactose transaminase